MRKCSNCGAELEAGQNRCPDCGAKHTGGRFEKQQPRKKKKSPLIWVILALLVALAGITTVMALDILKPGPMFTQETVPAPTTEAPTEATEIPATEPAPTQEETKPAWMEEMEQLEKEQEETDTEPQKRPGIGIGLIVGLCILSGILVFVLIGVLVFSRRRY